MKIVIRFLILFGEYISGGEMMLQNILMTLFYIVTVACVIWLIGYPIFTKIQHVSMNWTLYSLVTCIAAVIINVINIVLKITE